tara:strand:+ start:3146 stop:3970 length:825 start_codon:yes stop_codon:yes gene_type:complete
MDKKIGKFLRYPENAERFGEGGIRIKNINKKPKFTLITVVLNNQALLEKTIKSVLEQNFKNFEYIIIDGGSKDGTLDIIKKYNDKLDYWLSETDKGIYDAFNKGMELSRGEYIGIVNSDDTYRPNALSIISNYIDNNENIDFIFGSVQKRWGLLSGYKPWKIYFSWGFYSSHSTGFFIKRTAAEKVGYYNLKYKYHADYDYFFRMIVKKKLKGLATKKNEITGDFRSGGFSSNLKFTDSLKEDFRIRRDNGQNIILVLFVFLYRFIKNIKKVKN